MEADTENPTDITTVEAPIAAPAKPKNARASRNGKAGAAVRAATTKPAKAKPVKAKPAKAKATGRGKAPRTELPAAEMNKDERKLLDALWSSSGPREGKALHELQKTCWPKIKGTSKVRNTIRRLVKFGWLELQEPTKQEIAAHEKAGKGRLYSKYRLSEKGRKRGLN